jgi:hypothetical protein
MNWKGVKNWKCVYEAAMKHRVAIGLCAVCLSAFSPIVYYKGKSFWRKPRVAMCEGQGYRCGVERLPPDLCLNRQQRCLNDVDTEWDDRCMLSLGVLGLSFDCVVCGFAGDETCGLQLRSTLFGAGVLCHCQQAMDGTVSAIHLPVVCGLMLRTMSPFSLETAMVLPSRVLCAAACASFWDQIWAE